MKDINIDINCQDPIKKQGDLFGIFFEDLSHAADGGLYGELIQNRSFEFDAADREGYHSLTAWEAVERGDSIVQIHTELTDPLHKNNPHYLVMEVTAVDEPSGVRNQGYNTGLPIREGQSYHFSCFCRNREGSDIHLQINLEDQSGTQVYGNSTIVVSSTAWFRYECTIISTGTDYCGRIAVLAQEPSILELDLISLFPADTFMGRANGLRRDLCEILAAMNPKFLRFPGGCLTHVGSLAPRDRNSVYCWKNTIGPLEERATKRSMWNYNQSFGLGFYELFLLCEDLNAAPIPVVSGGCDPHFLRFAKPEQLQGLIDDALDLIEFANGSIDSGWGRIRSELGHPESFNLQYLAIGNEEINEEYFVNYEIMLTAIKARYPEIKVMNSAGPGSIGNAFNKGWKQARNTATSFSDEHYYQCPEWFIANTDRYYDYPNDCKVFLGEYASFGDTWYNALAEAAFMTGLEKAEAVGLACYAPMLNNVDYSNWEPNLIYFDNHRVCASASYYVQKLFMNYQGDQLLNTKDNIEIKSEKYIKNLPGNISLSVGEAEVIINNFSIQDMTNGKTMTVDDFVLRDNEQKKQCGRVESDQYIITFTFCKMNGGGTPARRGKSALSLFFAGLPNDDCLEWRIDGWQRLTSLNGHINGKGCDLGLYTLPIQIGNYYEAKLEVKGGTVKAYIDDALCFEHKCKAVVTEELYYSVVKETTGDIVVKIVNLEPEDKTVHIKLDEKKDYHVDIISMSGFDLSDRNSLDYTNKVVPSESQTSVVKGEIRYAVDGYSFIVMRCKKRER